MDVSTYMSESLGLQRRTAEIMEEMLKYTLKASTLMDSIVAGQALTTQLDPALGGGEQVQRTDEEALASREAANKAARDSAAAAQAKSAAAKKKAQDEQNAAAEEQVQADAKAAAAKKPKGPTVDDVRKALKAYAAIEGNEAAMALLSDHGSASVSALPEEKWADFIAACSK